MGALVEASPNEEVLQLGPVYWVEEIDVLAKVRMKVSVRTLRLRLNKISN